MADNQSTNDAKPSSSGELKQGIEVNVQPQADDTTIDSIDAQSDVVNCPRAEIPPNVNEEGASGTQSINPAQPTSSLPETTSDEISKPTSSGQKFNSKKEVVDNVSETGGKNNEEELLETPTNAKSEVYDDTFISPIESESYTERIFRRRNSPPQLTGFQFCLIQLRKNRNTILGTLLFYLIFSCLLAALWYSNAVDVFVYFIGLIGTVSLLIIIIVFYNLYLWIFKLDIVSIHPYNKESIDNYLRRGRSATAETVIETPPKVTKPPEETKASSSESKTSELESTDEK